MITQFTGAIDPTKYYEFQATPSAMVDRQAGIYSFSFDVNRDTLGARMFCVRGSLDNYAKNLPISSGTGITITTGSGSTGNRAWFSRDVVGTARITVDPHNGDGPDGTPLSAAGYSPFQQATAAQQASPVTFRIYAWNAEDPAGMFLVDSLTINGYSGIVENVQNYMEYSYCSIMFTEGQKTRARSALNSPTYQRNNLWTDENLAATGTAEGAQQLCPPVADFYAQVATGTQPVPFTPYVCTNVPVRFVDNSTQGAPTSWAWTFQDGTPATSTARNPSNIQFATSGWKTVTLTVTNAQGSNTKTDQYAVFVGAQDVAQGPYYEGFENMTGDQLYPYLGNNYDNSFTAWYRTPHGGYQGTASTKLNAATPNSFDIIDVVNEGDIDDLYTPLINMTGA
ncbi:MAG TPA: PKD domain-containing protein, partial [Flavobacteriales bacterium]|nr:PKD domain-containing protein [Flavobacteriales bacterium]